jgi:hypothetical protein
MLARRADDQWACMEVAEIVSRQNGKGSILEARVLAGLFLLREQLIMWSAHEYKDLDLTTPILTVRGWTTMGELQTGDEVFAPDGQPTKVLAAHPVLRDSDCYRVTFADGQSLVAGGQHLWPVTEVLRSGTTVDRVVTTEELRSGLVHTYPSKNRDRHLYRWRVALPRPLEYPEADLPIDPYLLGIWLGDGDARGGRLTVGAEDLTHVLDELDALGEKCSVAPDKRTEGRVWYVGVYGLRVRLRALGLLGNKRIPQAYLLASREQRAALLAGIMDTDGGVCGGHQLVVTMVKRDLMEDVTALIRSLGYRATLRTYEAKLNGQGAGPMHRAQFAPRDGSPFRLARKTNAIVRRKTSRSAYNAIVSVVRVPIRPTRCITVAHESGTYLAGSGFIPTHNTAMEAFIRVRTLIHNLIEAGIVDASEVKIAGTHGEEGVTIRATGQRLKFLARSKGSGRGFSGDLNVIDEAFAYTQSQHAALMPTVSARKNPQLIYTSSPPLDGDSGGVLYALRARALQGGDTSLGWRDWGAAGDLEHLQKIDLDDREIWAATNPALSIRITEETIARERRSLGPEEFARERLGVWPRQRHGAGAIDVAQWAKLLDPESRRDGAISLACDISPKRDYAAIGLYGLRSDGIGHVQLIDYRPGTEWLPERLEELKTTLNPVAIALGRGTAASLETELNKLGMTVPENKDNPRSGDLAIVGGLDMSGACGQIIDAVRQAELRHIGQQPLDLAVAGAKIRELTDTIAWSRKNADADICPLVVITLAKWAHEERAHLVQDYDVLESIF